MTNPTDWTSVLAIVGAGLIAGAMLIYSINRPKAFPPRYVIFGLLTLVVLSGGAFFMSKPKVVKQQPAAPQAAQAAQPDEALQKLEASVVKDPDNLELRNDLARAYVERDNLVAVYEQTQYVLAKSPQNSRALTYQALVKTAMGENEAAEQMLKNALVSDPSFLDAYVTLAWVHTKAGRDDEARKTMDEALRRHPDDTARLQHVFDQMKSKPFHLTVEGPAGEGVVFVIARPAGEEKGHPVAVKRIEASALPATFDFGDADSMMGEPLPASLRIEARLDRDGDVITKDPNDPSAFQDNVAAGASVKLSLK